MTGALSSHSVPTGDTSHVDERESVVHKVSVPLALQTPEAAAATIAERKTTQSEYNGVINRLK